MIYEVVPLEGIRGLISFGMKREYVRSKMAEDYHTFSRGGEWGTGIPVDFYINDGIFFYYDSNNELNALEFSRESKIRFAEMEIFNMKARDVIRYMSGIDKETLVTSDGATSRTLSLGLWSPDLDEDSDAPVESFLAGRSGYYDMVFE